MNYSIIPKWLLLTTITAAVSLSVYYFARYYVADELIYANYHVEALQEDLRAMTEELDAGKSRLAVTEHEVDIVTRANALLRASEREHQDEIAGLRADLAFYRRLGGASGSQNPLAVHYLELQATQSPRVYRIIFTLTQNLRWAAVISGRIELGIDGIAHGAAQHLTDSQLLAESADPLKFQFKYFQQLERLITLPEDFEPIRLTIRLKSRSLRTDVEQSMEWHSLFNEADFVTPVDEQPEPVGP